MNLSSFFFSSRRRHTRYWRYWSSDVCSSDLHNHKFDPISQKEFFQFYAFLNNQDEPQLEFYDDPAVEGRVKEIGRELQRSEERRVGKECRSRGSPYH